jgi:predicted nucleic acid-binding Zn ribbon protein
MVATAGVVTAVGVTSASAATIDTSGWYQLVSRHSGKAVDVCGQSTADHACIQQYAPVNQTNQQFQFVSSGSGYYRLKARHSGKVIDVLDFSTADGATLIQWPDTGATNQQWQVLDTDNGYVKLINRNSGKAMDVWEWSTADGGRISQFADLNGWNQHWRLVKISGGGTTTPPSTSWPTPTGQVGVNGTIQVPASGLDGGMRRYCCIGDGGQEESQDPMFQLAPGATLSNVIIGGPAGDGVHCSGACTLRNVWWEDVGEDAATFRGSGNPSFLVDGGGARSASDKVFQHNGAGTLTIQNFQVSNFGTFYRSCGNCSTQVQRDVVIRNVTLTRPGNTIAGINTNYGDTARFSGITIVNDSGRNMVVCKKYIGNDDGDEPDDNGSGADGTNCIYNSSDITYR